MANNIKLIVYPVKDSEKSKQFFNTYLNTEPYVDGEYYIGYRIEDFEIGLDPNGKAVVSYVQTDDIEASIKTLTDVSAKVVMDIKDVGGGLKVAQVEIDGNVLGLRQIPK